MRISVSVFTLKLNITAAQIYNDFDYLVSENIFCEKWYSASSAIGQSFRILVEPNDTYKIRTVFE